MTNSKYWFSCHVTRLGIHWRPNGPQGWLIMLGYILTVVIYPLIEIQNSSNFSIPLYVVMTVAATIGLLTMIYFKGEPIPQS